MWEEKKVQYSLCRQKEKKNKLWRNQNYHLILNQYRRQLPYELTFFRLIYGTISFNNKKSRNRFNKSVKYNESDKILQKKISQTIPPMSFPIGCKSWTFHSITLMDGDKFAFFIVFRFFYNKKNVILNDCLAW